MKNYSMIFVAKTMPREGSEGVFKNFSWTFKVYIHTMSIPYGEAGH